MNELNKGAKTDRKGAKADEKGKPQQDMATNTNKLNKWGHATHQRACRPPCIYRPKMNQLNEEEIISSVQSIEWC
jgi:hypothetical protein